MRALFNMATPPFLMKILNNYFQDRKVIYLTDVGEQEFLVMLGFLQHSVLATTIERYVRCSTSTAIAKSKTVS